MLHFVSTLVVLLLGIGLVLRHDRRRHPGIMGTAFVTDLALVVVIELRLHAVETVASSTNTLILFHAAVSLGVLVLYGVQIVLGVRLLRGQEPARRAHRRWGLVLFALRLVNFATSFLVGG